MINVPPWFWDFGELNGVFSLKIPYFNPKQSIVFISLSKRKRNILLLIKTHFFLFFRNLKRTKNFYDWFYFFMTEIENVFFKFLFILKSQFFSRWKFWGLENVLHGFFQWKPKILEALESTKITPKMSKNWYFSSFSANFGKPSYWTIIYEYFRVLNIGW